MFILNEKPLALDVPFTANDVSYPANWLRLASPEEREAVGISEVVDTEQPYDQRFYWNVGLPKDHAELVTQWVGQVKQTAGSLLSQTDWYITRFSETGIEAPQSVLERRTEVRALSNQKEDFLEATDSTDELAAYVTSPEFSQWEPVVVVEEPPTVDFVTSGFAFTASTVFGGEGIDTLSFNTNATTSGIN
jgi:hypothetical protein